MGGCLPVTGRLAVLSARVDTPSPKQQRRPLAAFDNQHGLAQHIFGFAPDALAGGTRALDGVRYFPHPAPAHGTRRQQWHEVPEHALCKLIAYRTNALETRLLWDLAFSSYVIVSLTGG